MEEHKHFAQAHRFASQELEMRRLALMADRKSWWGHLWGQLRGNLLSLVAMYRLLSDYGESTWKPLAWLVFAAFWLFPVLYGWAGVVYDGYLVEVSLTAAALLPAPEGAELGLCARMIQVLERIIAPFLALLFTLAVRRRFQR